MKIRPNRKPPGGFALVVTLSLMILLTVIAVGLLTLSSISMRSASQSSDLATARSNARMALMLAVGELQKTVGQDTRVTARADIVNANNGPVLGVWESWKGEDHEANGRPKAPNYADHKSARFLAWLTSESAASTAEVKMSSLPNTTAGGDRVALIGEATVGDKDAPQRQIYMTPTKVSVGVTKGSYAWWVGGKNQKARLPRPYAPASTSNNAAGWAVLAKSHSPVDTSPFGLDKLLKDDSLTDASMASAGAKAVTIKQSDLLQPTVPSDKPLSRDSYHDLSVNSVGLLTNTATGGWRKDLSLLTENYETGSFPSSNLPLFRVNPDKDLTYDRPLSTLPQKSLLYPWSDYRRMAVTNGNEAIYRFPPIGSWANLVNYSTLYRTVMGATSSAVAPTVSTRATPINGNVNEFIQKVRILPVIARVQWIYHHRADLTAGKYDVKLAVQPVITLWNPYNVRLASPGPLTFELIGSLPPVISYTICGAKAPVVGTTVMGVTLQDSSMSDAAKKSVKGAFSGSSIYTIATVPTFNPGETKIFSPNSESDGSVPITMVEGYKPSVAGAFYGSRASIASTTGPSGGNDKITTDISFNSEFNDGGTGVGMYMNMKLGYCSTKAEINNIPTVLAYRMLFETSKAYKFYPPLTADKLQTFSLGSITGTPSPFLSVTFGARMASNTHMPSKGFVQSSPFVNYTAMGMKGPAEETIRYAYPGALNTVNSPFEFSFQPLLPNNVYMPNSDSGNHGFIVTGFTSGTGLSRCVIGELPTRPLLSLAELQNWDARYENPVPPFSYNLVGNSDANPLFPSNAVVNGTEVSAKGMENLQHDDSYCLNHMLWDDWFFSGITPEPANFGAPTATGSAKTTYTNLLRDPTKPLGNRAYKPIRKDLATASASATAATALATANMGTAQTAFKSIASRLEVEGMFNVNSTSVKAWRALLGHARNQRVPYMGANGGPQLSSEADYPFSRFSVAGDVEASGAGFSGTFGSSAQYAGYRQFTASQLDALAENIVEQVRLRGPFLSLSEFVNRQLSSGNLALAGAVQSALYKLSTGNMGPDGDSGPNDPYSVVKTNTAAKDSEGNKPPNYASTNPAGVDAGYKWPEAAKGYSLYGLPGWTRQADVLRQIAPVLSARDDTFTIRAYGDARDVTGKIIKARAMCEATIRRTRDYMDITSVADTTKIDEAVTGGIVPAKSTLNTRFGRRFEMVSFRWLSPDEV